MSRFNDLDYEIFYYKNRKQKTNNMHSKFLTLNLLDLGKGALVAFLSAFIAVIIQTIDANQLPTLPELTIALKVGAAAGIGYLLKNLLSGLSGKFLQKQ